MKSIKRPKPPAKLLNNPWPAFLPEPKFEAWSQHFLDEDGLLSNPDHAHLQAARIGVLWTNVEASRQMMRIVGQAEIPTPPPSGGKWSRAKFEYQITEWFGHHPLDFLITLYAPYAIECDDLSFCSLFEHELYHCGQRVDEFGEPKFRKDGTPVFGIRGHDVEEHVGIVRRYGARAGAGLTVELINAAKSEPEVGAAQIAVACGTCRLAG